MGAICQHGVTIPYSSGDFFGLVESNCFITYPNRNDPLLIG